jgi:hypothetical protein
MSWILFQIGGAAVMHGLKPGKTSVKIPCSQRKPSIVKPDADLLHMQIVGSSRGKSFSKIL